MKTISLPLIVELALVFALWSSAPAQAYTPYNSGYSGQQQPSFGPFYPYPQVPLGWRQTSTSWDDGWWFLDYSDAGRR
jgi:hypothetical protein